MLKSWQEEFNQQDVVNALSSSVRFRAGWDPAIIGDGDIVLTSQNNYDIISLADMLELNDIFKPLSLTIEIDSDPEDRAAFMFITMSWNG